MHLSLVIIVPTYHRTVIHCFINAVFVRGVSVYVLQFMVLADLPSLQLGQLSCSLHGYDET